jgi:uncharacterized protein (DUF58 family)
MKIKALSYWEQWIKKRNPKGNPQVLKAHQIYILPSTFGWMYALLLLTLFSGAINYQISSIFLMTFLLAIIGLISAWEAQANLNGLVIKLISVDDTEQGKPALLNLLIQASPKTRFALAFQIDKNTEIRLEKIPVEGVQFTLPLATSARGYFPVPRIAISSFFPFTIFQVWSYAYFDESYYVYPTPLALDFWPATVAKNNNQSIETTGTDEFYDLKPTVHPWAQPNRIAWKIAAKGMGWHLKTMTSSESDYWLFKLNELPKADIETKLQHLSYLLQSAEAKGYVYSMELNQGATPFSQGEDHLNYCLRQLATYQ